MNKKLLFALLGIFLMTSGVFALIAYIPAGTIGSPQSSPALSNVGETAGTSIGVNYWTNGAVSNSGTTNVNLPVVENSSYSSTTFDNSASWKEVLFSGNSIAKWYIVQNFPLTYFWLNQDSNTVTLDDAMFALAVMDYTSVGEMAAISTIYANISFNGLNFEWSYNFNFQSSNTVSSQNTYGFIDPSWNIQNAYYSIETSTVPSINFTYIITGTNVGNSIQDNPLAITTTTGYQGQNTIIQNPSVSTDVAVPFAIGYHFNSASTSFTIPQYESSFDLTWSSSSSSNPQYNSQSPSSTSGTLTGSLTSNSFTVYPVGDPAVYDSSGITFSYYLSSQNQVSSASAPQTSSPTYTYTQVSGTTNQASASFSFSGSTPSTAVFIPYESSQNSLTTTATNIVFSPSVTVQNPYSSYAQNELVASLSGASSGSSTTSGTASPSFTGDSASYTSASSPSWTVDLNLYGNRHPVYQNSAISLTKVNPLTPVSLYANYSETDFSGETQYLQSSWNGRALESSASTTDALSQQSHFSTTGSKTITYYASNSPNPSTNSLGSLDSGSSSLSVNVLPFSLTPSPVDYSSVGTSVLLTLKYSTQTSALMSQIDLTVNSVLEDRFQPDLASGTVKYDFTQPVASPLLVTWTATDQYGYSQSITFQYGSNLTPAEYSNKVTVLQSPNATHSYPISLSGVPTGTGFYQQLITISNPSSYGINTAGSNLQFTAGNNTLLYAWIQSINSTAMQVWIKNYYGNSVIDMQVLPSFENLFSVNGYLSDTSGSNVFPQFYNFAGISSLPSGWIASNYILTSSGIELIGNSSNNAYLLLSGEVYNLTQNIVGETASVNSIGNLAGDGIEAIGTSAGTEWFTGYNDNSAVLSFYAGTSNVFDTSQPIPIQPNAFESYALWESPHGSTEYGEVNGNYVSQAYNYYTNQTFRTRTEVYSNQVVNITVKNVFVASYVSSMPTFSIGTGTPFVANSTTTNHLHYQIESAYPYNQTLGAFTYTIYDSFNTNNLTIIYNSAWTFEYSDPEPVVSGYDFNGKFLTWVNISGIGTITVTFLQPNPQIGSASIITVQPEQDGTSVILNSLHLVVGYYPYDSTTLKTVTSYNPTIDVPFGSIATFYLYNQWNQLIGEVSNVSILQTTGTLTMPVNVATLSFDFVNATETPVNLAVGSLNYSFYGTAVVGLNYTYVWTTSAYDLFYGKSINYTGSVYVNKTNYLLTINTNAPPSALQVIINGYNASNQGELGVPGTPSVNLYIDGQKQTPGATYTAFVGSSYNITITDVLGQVLFTKIISVTTTTDTYYADITTPSWQWSIQNQEQIPSNSPLATEHISLNLNGTNTYYNFTNQVGQQAVLYLKQGDYNISAKDNATFATSFDLTQNENYVIFGQGLLTYAEFEALMNEVLNNTKGINLVTVHSVTTVEPSQSVSYELNAYFTNDTELSNTQLLNSEIILQITNASGSIQLSHTIIVSGQNVYVNLSAPPVGTYTVVIGVIYDSVGGRASYSLTTQAIQLVSKGMIFQVAGPETDVIINETYNYTLVVDYSNGTSMDLQDTKSVYNNLTFTFFNGLDPIQKAQLISYSAGVILFNVTFNQTGTFTIYIQGHAMLIEYASATALIPVTIQKVVYISQGIIVTPSPSSSTITVNETYYFIIGLNYQNNTPVNLNDTRAAYNNMTFTIFTVGTDPIQSVAKISYVAGAVTITVVMNVSASYNILIKTNETLNHVLAYGQNVLYLIVKPPVSNGIIDTLSSSSYTIQANTTNKIVVNFEYSNNNTLMDATDTQITVANTIAQLYLNGNFYHNELITYVQPGEAVITMNISDLQQFSLKVYTGPFAFHNNKNATGYAFAQIIVVNYNPNQNSGNQVPYASFADAIAGFFEKFWEIIVVISTVVGFGIPVYQAITSDRRAVKKQFQKMQADEVEKQINSILTPEQRIQLAGKPYRKQIKYLSKLGFIPKPKYKKLEYLAVQDDKSHKDKLNL